MYPVIAGAKPVAPDPGGGGGADRGHCCRKTMHPCQKRELGKEGGDGESGDGAGPVLNRRRAPAATRPPCWGPPLPAAGGKAPGAMHGAAELASWSVGWAGEVVLPPRPRQGPPSVQPAEIKSKKKRNAKERKQSLRRAGKGTCCHGMSPRPKAERGKGQEREAQAPTGIPWAAKPLAEPLSSRTAIGKHEQAPSKRGLGCIGWMRLLRVAKTGRSCVVGPREQQDDTSLLPFLAQSPRESMQTACEHSIKIKPQKGD